MSERKGGNEDWRRGAPPLRVYCIVASVCAHAGSACLVVVHKLCAIEGAPCFHLCEGQGLGDADWRPKLPREGETQLIPKHAQEKKKCSRSLCVAVVWCPSTWPDQVLRARACMRPGVCLRHGVLVPHPHAWDGEYGQ